MRCRVRCRDDLWLARHLTALPEALVAKYGVRIWIVDGDVGVGVGVGTGCYGRIRMHLVKVVCQFVSTLPRGPGQRSSHRLVAAYLLIAFNLSAVHTHRIEILF